MPYSLNKNEPFTMGRALAAVSTIVLVMSGWMWSVMTEAARLGAVDRAAIRKELHESILRGRNEFTDIRETEAERDASNRERIARLEAILIPEEE